MLQLIRSLLQNWIDDIDSGNSNITESDQRKVINFIRDINSEELSKIQAADYLGISRATFDRRVDNGEIPKGCKKQGFNELIWFKSELK